MIRTLFALGAVLALAACDPAVRPSEPVVVPVTDPAPTDQCGAAALKNLVGKPRTEIPQAPESANRRVTCNTCPVTRDYRPDRLNIFYDAETGIVTDVNCG